MTYVRTPEHCANISASRKRHIASHADNCLCVAVKGRAPKNLEALHSARIGQPLPISTRAKISRALKRKGIRPPSRKGVTGVVHLPEWRTNIGAGRRRHLSTHKNCACLGQRAPSQLSLSMIKCFLNEFPMVVPEKQFGPFIVDAYLPPPYHLAWEADGEYWHNRRGRDYDEARDAYLLVEFNLPIVRLTEAEIKTAAKLWGPNEEGL